MASYSSQPNIELLQFHPDIEGLRAIAVLVVVLFHARFIQFSGGYIGVDVFFVISGFLITGKIRKDLTNRRFSLRKFYVARARRLFPAYIATVACTLIGAALVFSPYHFGEAAKSAVFSTLPTANFFFWQSAGYWDIGSQFKPLLHMWSLSVEEQFYFIWPFTLLMLPSRKAIWAIIVASAISFLAGLYYGGISPNAVFYLPWFRVFEFGIGAAVTWIPPVAARPVREILSAAGVLMILYAATQFLGAESVTKLLVPCCGTALAIYGGETSVARLWNNPAGWFVGRISYSMYLVHWPLIVFYAYWRGDAITHQELLALVFACILLAWPMYRYVEQPFRKPRPSNRRFGVSWAGLTASAIFVSSIIWINAGWPYRGGPNAAILAYVNEPLCQNGKGLCSANHPSVVLIGDSHADAYAPAIALTLRQLSIAGKRYPTGPGCSVLLGAYSAYAYNEANSCPALHRQWLDQLKIDKPKLIIDASFYEIGIAVGYGGRLTTGHFNRNLNTAEARDLFVRQINVTMDYLTKDGTKVLVMGNGPTVDTPPSACYGVKGNSVDCDSKIVISDPSVAPFVRSVMKNISSDNPNIFFFDAYQYLCNDKGNCALGDGPIPFYYDRHHFTKYGSIWMAENTFSDVREFISASVSEH